MSTISELDEQQLEFLTPYLPPISQTSPISANRPFVTLTYACSLDGMISLSPGVRTTLSGAETKSMTHYLRLKHDAILVGVGTAVADNPSLNCRYPGVTPHTQPRPFIVDPSSRWNPSGAAVVDLARREQSQTPCIVCRDSHATSTTNGVSHMVIEAAPDVPLDWSAILSAMKADGVESIMIEGGATILNTLLLRPELVDSVIVTIAPTWLGQEGVHVSPPAQHQGGIRINAATLSNTSWKQFGADVVLCGRLQPSISKD